MTVAARNIVHQRRVLASLVHAAVLGALRKRRPAPGPLPGPEHSQRVAPLPDPLVRDFIKLVGGDPAVYRRHLPPHLFPQWTFPLIVKVLEDVPYSFPRIVNAGCTLRINEPIPARVPLVTSARLAEIDDNGRRALITVGVKTGTERAPEALTASFRALVPLRGGGKNRAAEKPRIPDTARELARFSFPEKAGLDFAKATGDFNPIHWSRRYARMMGFQNVILHGFGSLAWAMEGLARGLLAGDVGRIRVLDASFTRPLVLPRTAGLYLWEDRRIGLGDAPGGPAYMLGHFEVR